MENFYAVIMAGGGGTRLWPLSRKSRPKQMLRIIGGKTLFQMSVDRLLPLIPPERILVVTVEAQSAQLQEQAPSIPRENFLLEPEPKGTASVIGLAAIHLHHKAHDNVMAVVTADHFIQNEDRFRELLKVGYEVAMQDELVTLGITPTYAATGYGYIQQGEKVGEYDHFSVFRALTFKEKPHSDLAEQYLESGEYAWNSGMFVWKVDRILGEIERLMPPLFQGLRHIQEAFDSTGYHSALAKVWSDLRTETIDYGVMERAQRVCVIPADGLGWLDIGGWDRLFEVLEADANGNLVLAEDTVSIDVTHSLIYQEQQTDSSRLIALIGLHDLILVDTGEIVLVCPRHRAEEVKAIVKKLSEEKKEGYL
jgi:mannose-1-phosphate guanylyltransferase